MTFYVSRGFDTVSAQDIADGIGAGNAIFTFGASSPVTFDDSVICDAGFQVNGPDNAYFGSDQVSFDNNVIIGSSSVDVLTINATIGASSDNINVDANFFFHNNVDIGSGSADTLTVVATAFFNNDVDLGSNSSDTINANGKIFILGGIEIQSQWKWSHTTSSTVGAAGGADAIPSNPDGYLTINVAGTTQKVPYFAA